MLRFIKKRSSKRGLPPGSLIHVGEYKAKETTVSYLDYDQAAYREKDVGDISECFPLKDTGTVSWINIVGLQDVSVLEEIKTHFDIHPLALEDIVTGGQTPKVDDYEEYLFIVLKMLYHDPKLDEIVAEQVSLILGPHYVISFQERMEDVFDPIRERIRHNKGRIRKGGADYLAYALLDAIIDNYFVVIEKLGERIEPMEDRLLLGKNVDEDIAQQTHHLKGELIFLRKQVWPLREVIGNLHRGGSKLIKKNSLAYLKDIYDHTIQVIDTIESYRDVLSSMHDIYLTSISNKMNETMKTLTIIATIFIPMTFVAGVYGMNFQYMPELQWKWGYFVVLGLMALIAIGMLIFFRKKKWL